MNNIRIHHLCKMNITHGEYHSQFTRVVQHKREYSIHDSPHEGCNTFVLSNVMATHFRKEPKRALSLSLSDLVVLWVVCEIDSLSLSLYLVVL